MEKNIKTASKGVRSMYEWLEEIVFALVAVILVFTFLFRVVTVTASRCCRICRGRKGRCHEPRGTTSSRAPWSLSRTFWRNPSSSASSQRRGRRSISITTPAPCISTGEALNETQFGIENGITFHPYDGYEALVFPQTVPKGCVFVLGDNRTVSRDSRYAEIGMIDTRHIMGEAVFTLYPFDRFGFVKTNENN